LSGNTHRLGRPTAAPPLYAQDGKGLEAEVHAHYFLGDNDWLVSEYDPDEDIAFGWACINGDRQLAELGYISLAELESIRVPLRVRDLSTGQVLESKSGVSVELEEGWPTGGMTLRQAIDELDRRQGRG
jgi:hypothetical protein